MKKIGLFLFALALVAVALVDRPAEAANCVKPVCSSSFACCNNSECEAYCRSIGRGMGGCLILPGTTGGCCGCRPLEG
jgi:hypothetical protein